MATDLHTMTNTEWLDAVQAVLLDDGEDAALDVVYESISDAHDAPDRLDALLLWLDPDALPTLLVLGVLSVSRRPVAHVFEIADAMGRGVDGPKPLTSLGLDSFARRAVRSISIREPAEDVRPMLKGLVDDALLTRSAPLATSGWRVRDPQRIVRNACLQAKEECPVGVEYASRDEALEDVRVWLKKWAHQLYFQNLDTFARIASENGWWLCTRIRVLDDSVGGIPKAMLLATARRDVHGVPELLHGCIEDAAWFTIEPSRPHKAGHGGGT